MVIMNGCGDGDKIGALMTHSGFHLGISSWGGSSRITWPYGHGEERVDFIITISWEGGRLGQFGGGGGGGGGVKLFGGGGGGGGGGSFPCTPLDETLLTCSGPTPAAQHN